MKKYYVMSTTEGCATNLLENAGFRKKYDSLGYHFTDDPETADLILINTCAYNKVMEGRATDVITDFQRKFPKKEILLAGCLPKINPAKVKSIFTGTVLKTDPRAQDFSSLHQFNKHDFDKVSKKHKFILKLRPIYFWIEKAMGRELRPLHNIMKTVVVNEKFFLLTVSTGCVGKCTFCAIKRAKGSLRSRPLQTILSEFEEGLKVGYRDFWLLGDDIGCWGQDVQSNVADLLSAILDRKESFSLVLNYLDPHFLVRYADQLRPLLFDRRIIGINLPIQSGSRQVLKKMAREYEPEKVYALIRDIKMQNPGLAIKTNVMVGFPGETLKDYVKSLFSVFHFDAVLSIKYASRPHTPAENFSDQVPETIKRIRLALMNCFVFMRHSWVSIRSIVAG